MKKIVLSVLGSVLIFGVGTVVMAAASDDMEKGSIEKMMPFMEEMHPDFSNEELKEMYDSCHGDNGMMKDQNMENMNPKNLMNQF